MSQQSTRQYGADPRDVQYGNGQRGGPAPGIPTNGDPSRSRGSDPSSTDRRPPQYQDSYDDDYYGPPSNTSSRPPAAAQPDNKARVITGGGETVDRNGDKRQPAPRPGAAPAGSYDNQYDDNDDNDDDQYRERQVDDGRRPRNDTANRQQGDLGRGGDRRDDPRVAAAGNRHQGDPDRADDIRTGNPRAIAVKKDGVAYPSGRQGSKDELNEMAHHLELLRQENVAMREKLNDSKKRERELEEMAKKKKGDGSDSFEVEKLKAELEKKTKKLEKLSKQSPAMNFDGDTGKMISKIQELQKENDKLKKGLASGSHDMPELEKMASTLKAKDKLIQEINEEKDELMAILEEDGTAEKFKKMKKKTKDLKKKNEELKMANEQMEAELMKGKPDSEYVGKFGKKSCQNCEQLKKGVSAEVFKSKDLPKDMRPLQELVREQESHILDLQREVDTLRHAINDYQKEIERLEAANQDMEEGSGNGSPRLLMERKAAMEEDAELRRDLEQSRRKLRSSNRRVAQLEKWLDEIYNDKNFEIVVKGAAFRGRKTTLALPDIQGGSGETTARKGLGRKSFKTAEPVTAKSTRSSFNF